MLSIPTSNPFTSNQPDQTTYPSQHPSQQPTILSAPTTQNTNPTMSSTTTTTPNYSLHSLPLAFLFGLLPHTYVTARLMHLTSNTSSKAMPRANLETWKSKLPAATWNHLVRARGAHLNCMEVFPLFAAAVVSVIPPSFLQLLI
jgi:hypothetical protein